LLDLAHSSSSDVAQILADLVSSLERDIG
jgi:hypothetical protein